MNEKKYAVALPCPWSVPKGWELHITGGVRCSHCFYYNFCPNCGREFYVVGMEGNDNE